MTVNFTPAEEKVVVRMTLRIIPFVFLLYIISYLDRANIGYAIGLIKGSGKSATPGLVFLAALLAVAFLMTLFMRLSAGIVEPVPDFLPAKG